MKIKKTYANQKLQSEANGHAASASAVQALISDICKNTKAGRLLDPDIAVDSFWNADGSENFNAIVGFDPDLIDYVNAEAALDGVIQEIKNSIKDVGLPLHLENAALVGDSMRFVFKAN